MSGDGINHPLMGRPVKAVNLRQKRVGMLVNLEWQICDDVIWV